ncbi:MAG: DUF1588 domain-containing protein [Proteobacteria bacterium]|nr:MAG: DUF1588 domain-containing protein [Pseudomonadota bacterium]
MNGFRIYLILASLITCVVAFQNCSAGFTLEAATVSSPSLNPGDLNFKEARKVLELRCVSCHSPNGSAAQSKMNFKSESEFIGAGLISPGSPESSKLLLRLRGYAHAPKALANMPSDRQLPVSEIQKLVRWINEIDPTTGPFTCVDDPTETDRPQNHARRLSKSQYINTLIDLLSRFLTTSEASQLVDSAVISNPIPLDATRYERNDNDLSAQHASAFFRIADFVANALTGDAVKTANFISKVVSLNPGICTSLNVVAMSGDCRKQFIRNLALRTLRRPLRESTDENEVSIYLDEFSKEIDQRLAVGNIFFRFLIAPSFLMRLEVDERKTKLPTVLDLSPYAIANRLSYTYWNTMPDEVLLMMAQNSNLRGPDLQFAVTHVMENTKLDRTLKEFARDWLRLGDLPNFSTSSASSQLFANGQVMNSQVRQEMISEIEELVSYVSFSKGSFRDLFTTDVSFARSNQMKAIYGTSVTAAPVVTTSNAVHLPLGTRSGILTRAALVAGRAGNGASNPVLRGAMIKTDILCAGNGSPPVDVGESLNSVVRDSNMTVRGLFTKATEQPACMSCHQVINPVGFGLSNYNGFGFYQEFEPAFNPDGTYASKRLAVDASADLTVAVGRAITVRTPAEYSAVIADAISTRSCFTTNLATYLLAREPSKSEGCRLNRVFRHTNASSTLRDAMESITHDPEFTIRYLDMD